MPYIATDLDAFDDADAVAGSTGLPPPMVLGGLARTWRWCWRNKTDRVTAEQIAGFFCSPVPGLPSALVAFGFLEAGDTYRVRGVDRYLRLSEARRRGGLAAKSNLVPGARQRKKSLGTSREGAQSVPGITSGSDSALSAKVEGRRSKNDEKILRAAPAAPLEGEDPAYRAFVAALFVIFREDRGRDPQPDGKNWKALQRLRERHEAAEIIRRWGHGVKAAYKRRCSSFVDLEAKWDECGDAEPAQTGQRRPTGADPNQGILTADVEETEEERKWIEHLGRLQEQRKAGD